MPTTTVLWTSLPTTVPSPAKPTTVVWSAQQQQQAFNNMQMLAYRYRQVVKTIRRRRKEMTRFLLIFHKQYQKLRTKTARMTMTGRMTTRMMMAMGMTATSTNICVTTMTSLMLTLTVTMNYSTVNTVLLDQQSICSARSPL